MLSRLNQRRAAVELLEQRQLLTSITVLPVTTVDAATSATYNVALSAASKKNIIVAYATSNGTAHAGKQFVNSHGQIIIDAGKTTGSFSVRILDDPTTRVPQTFYVHLAASGKNPITKKVLTTITDYPAAPTVTVSDVMLTVKNAKHPPTGVVTVKLSNPSASLIELEYSTQDGTAVAGTDYVAEHGVLKIKPGQTSVKIPVRLKASTATGEPDKSFDLLLSNVANATVPADTFSRAVIVDDDTVGGLFRPTITVASASAIEGNDANFAVTLSAASPFPVSFRYATVPVTASASRFNATSGILTIPAGQTSAVISVPTIRDAAVEPQQQFALELSGAANGIPANLVATGTIIDAGPEPTISVADVSAPAGTEEDFVVSLTAASTQAVTVNYATADGTATAVTDYVAASGTLTFAPGQISQTVAVTLDPVQITSPETFSLSLSDPTNATVATASATATILPSAVVPALTVTGGTLTQGANGTSTLTFAVSLSTSTTTPVTVAYTTADGTATAGTSYQAASGTLTFSPGQTTQNVDVTVYGQAIDATQTFTLNLSSPGNATIATGTAVGTIIYTNSVVTTPSLVVSGGSVTVGSSPTTLPFTVSLSSASASTITVDYATADGTAIAGTDYTAVSGVVTFDPGQTSKVVDVTVDADTVVGSNKTFTLNLTSPANATIATASATGTLVNNNAVVPTIGVTGGSVTVGGSPTTLPFTVTLSSSTTSTVTVDYATANGTAVAGTDYTAASGVLTFSPGQTSKTVDVTVDADTAVGSNKTFTLNLTSPSNATIATASATGTLVNDNTVVTPPTINVTGGSVTVGSSAQALAFTVALSASSTSTVTVDYATADGTAIAGTDYTAASGVLTFSPGQTSKTVDVTVAANTAVGPTKTFTLNLTSPSNATIATASATGTIVNNNTAPVPSIGVTGGTATVGSSATSLAFTVSLSTSSTTTVSVNYATANGSATAGTDYVAASGTLTFSPGQTSKTVSVTIDANTAPGSTKTFTLNLSSPSNATIATASATGTIDNNNTAPTPSISVANASVTQGSASSTTLPFIITLSAPSTSTVTVAYATADGTALNGIDYQAASGTATFSPQSTTTTVNITIYGNVSSTGSKTFSLNLSSPSNATLATSTATGTISYTGIDLSDNLSDAASDVNNVSGSAWQAASFGTGTSAVTLKSITIPLAQQTSGPVTMQLYSDAGGQPGTPIGTLTNPASFSSSGANTTFTTTGIALAANTTYWIVLSANGSGSYNWSWTSSDNGTGVGFQDQWSQSMDSGNTWYTTQGFPLIMQVLAST
jgi:chitinase